MNNQWQTETLFKCAGCLGTVRSFDGRKSSEVKLGNDILEVVTDFCYLCDVLSAGGCWKISPITKIKCA